MSLTATYADASFGLDVTYHLTAVNPADVVDVENTTSCRVQSPEFSFTAPTPRIFGTTGGAGLSVGGGYYLLVPPPSANSHGIHYKGTIHFDACELGAGAPAADYPVDMTYNITVAPDSWDGGGPH